MACLEFVSAPDVPSARLALPHVGLAVVELDAAGPGIVVRALDDDPIARSAAMHGPLAVALCHRAARPGRPIATWLVPLPSARVSVNAARSAAVHALHDGDRLTMTRDGRSARVVFRDQGAPESEPFAGNPHDCPYCLVRLDAGAPCIVCPSCGLTLHAGCWQAVPACPACGRASETVATGHADRVGRAGGASSHG